MRLIGLLLLAATSLAGWGIRGHQAINRAAVAGLPDDGPVFLKAHEEWIAYLSIIPDSWRSPSELALKILEDPNHGWFKEQFAMLPVIPRSRYEFVLALEAEYRKNPSSKLTNVRWTGTLPYAAQENFERLRAAMRRYRSTRAAGQDTKFVELEIAQYMGRLGHYTGDGAQPLHDTIHHDGWVGDNPAGYTRDPRIHGRMESQFVDLIAIEAKDLAPGLTPARRLADPFLAILAHLDQAASYVEEVYQLDLAGAWTRKDHPRARALVRERLAAGAVLLRDLTYTAWLESAAPVSFDRGNNPIDPNHPAYNPATGSAPPGPPVPQASAAQATAAKIEGAASLEYKAFFVLTVLGRSPLARQSPALVEIGTRKRAALALTGSALVEALRFTPAEIDAVAQALTGATALEGPLRASNLYVRHHALAPGSLPAQAWRGAAEGINRILDVYALGHAPRYPAIDSPSFDVKSANYQRLLQILAANVAEAVPANAPFFEVPFRFALDLLRANWRDEASRFEPLATGENRAAFRRVSTVDWKRYRYTAIVVPGSGTDRVEQALSPWGRTRVALAARRYRDGLAPFILVSGGYVHPNQTPHCEALEMKKALREEFGIPEEAILMDPHARHTTTNLRNAGRILLRYGFPADKPAVVTTDPFQSTYIEAPGFAERCEKELGYVPYTVVKRISAMDLEFLPKRDSLHADPLEPLDP